MTSIDRKKMLSDPVCIWNLQGSDILWHWARESGTTLCMFTALCVYVHACTHVCSYIFVSVCVCVCWKALHWMSTFNSTPSSLNANENKEREIVGTLKQQGKNQQSETEKAKPYSAKRDFIRFSSAPLKYMVVINPPLNVLWVLLFYGQRQWQWVTSLKKKNVNQHSKLQQGCLDKLQGLLFQKLPFL